MDQSLYFLFSCLLLTTISVFTDKTAESFERICHSSVISKEARMLVAIPDNSETINSGFTTWTKNMSSQILLPSLVTLTDDRYQTPRPFCGGVIIDSEWVLTTAFCLSAYQPKDIVVNTCELEFPHTFGKHQLTRGKKIIIHKRYDSFSLVNDIALLKVSPVFNFTSKVSPAELNCKASFRRHRDEVCKVYGWNVQYMMATFFKEMLLKVMSKYQCQKMYPNLISSSMFCAISQDNDWPCLSNWGTPLMCGEDLVGLASWTNGCPKHEFPAVFISVCRYLKWIQYYI